MMGYFANGTAGMEYEEKYCTMCVHYEDCPVLLAHMLYNYDQHGNKKLADVLDLLIPCDVDGANGKCTMFLEAN